MTTFLKKSCACDNIVPEDVLQFFGFVNRVLGNFAYM